MSQLYVLTLNFLDDYLINQALLQTKFLQYTYASQNNFSSVMEYLSFDEDMFRRFSYNFYRCNPKRHIENETYVQFTKIDQAFVINEANMDGDYCSGSCEDRKTGSHSTCYEGSSFLCDRNRPCFDFFDCEKKTTYIHVCLPYKPFAPSTARRYDHIMFTNNGQSYHFNVTELK